MNNVVRPVCRPLGRDGRRGGGEERRGGRGGVHAAVRGGGTRAGREDHQQRSGWFGCYFSWRPALRLSSAHSLGPSGAPALAPRIQTAPPTAVRCSESRRAQRRPLLFSSVVNLRSDYVVAVAARDYVHVGSVLGAALGCLLGHVK